MADHTRIVVADDHPLLRQGVVQVLDAEPDFQVVGEAGTVDEVVSRVKELSPDLVVLDLGMPGGGGMAAIARISAESPSTAILVLTVSEDRDDLMKALRTGALGYVLKGVSGVGLAHAVRVVAGGDAYVSPSLAGAMLYEITHEASPLDRLTDREREVLELLAGGLTNREIGARLYLAEKTVKHHMTSVLQKLQVRSRLEAALLAQREMRGRGESTPPDPG